MTAAAWGDPEVAQALRDVVQPADGEPRVSADGLREALEERLGGRAEEFAEAVSALVAAAEAGIPQGVLDDVPAIDLGDLLDDAGLEPRAAGWALAAWGQALRTTPARVTPALEAPTVVASPPPVLPSEETRPLPRVEAEILTRPVSGLGAERSEPLVVPEPADEPAGEPEPEVRGIRTVKTRSRFPVPIGVVVAMAAVGAVGVAGVLAMTGRDVVSSYTPGAATASPGPSADVTGLARPLAHAGGGENFPLQTQAAMLDAAARGDIVEADLRWTLDGVPVLYDAATVSGRMTCSRPYAVALTSWDTLKQCRTPKGDSPDGKRYGIPPFDETLKKLAAVEDAQLYIEIKADQTPAQNATLVKLLRRNKMLDRTVVTSFDGDRLNAVRDRAQDVQAKGLRYLRFVRDDGLSAKAAQQAGLYAVGVRYDQLTERYLTDLHDRGLKVVVWTPNQPKLWAQAREAGVDGVLTDKPVAYRAWFARQR